MIVNTGFTALIKAAAGSKDYVVNGMYAVFTNSAPVEPVPDVNRTPDYYKSLAAPFGYIRFRTLSAPEYTDSGTGPTEDVATFFGVAGSTAEGGAALIDGTSRFIEVALVAMPDIADSNRDVIISAGAVKASGVFAPLSKIANSQCAFKWSLQIG